MIVTLLKLGLLLLSYFGWWEFFRERCRVNVFFAPFLTVAVHFTALFLPGLLNLLPEAAWALYLGGFLLLADALRREKLSFLKYYVNWGYLLLFAALALMALAFRGKMVTWFDNFTHWATAVKNMLAADRFPTFAQPAVTFTTYPLGSTTLIWYFCRFTGGDEDFWMLAQGFLMLCSLLPLFAFGKEKSPLMAIFGLVAGNFLLLYNTPLTELLVDTLLPLAGTAMLLFLHRECLREEEPLPVWYGLAPLFWVMNIKNAGLLFVLAGMLILLKRSKQPGRDRRPLLMMGLILLTGYLLWEKHCDYVFYQDTVSQHEISLEYFRSRLGDKSLADVGQIIRLLAKSMVVRRELAMVLLTAAVLGGMTRWLAAERKKAFTGLLGFLAVSFGVYAVSLMGMYITTMSREAALELQSADRYIRIWEIMALYLLLVYGAALMDRLPGAHPARVVLTAGLAALCLVYYSSDREMENSFAYDPAMRLEYEAPAWEYGVQPGYSYLILAEDDRYWYPAFLWMYHMDSDRVLQLKVTEESQMAVEKHYDYVVILDEGNPVIQAWVEKTYPDQAGKAVIQCFK